MYRNHARVHTHTVTHTHSYPQVAEMYRNQAVVKAKNKAEAAVGEEGLGEEDA